MKPFCTFSEKKTVIFARKEGSLYNNYFPFHPTETDLPPPSYPPIWLKKGFFPLFLNIIQVLCNIHVLIVVVPCSSGIDLTYSLNDEIN